MGWESPQEALGKKFKSLNGNERVIGVFNDFHQTSLHEAAGPFVLNMKENPAEIAWFLKYMTVKIKNGSDKDAISFIEQKWKEVSPDRPFEYFYLSDELSNLYKDEENLSKLSFLFSIIIMFIAGLGLLGLVSYTAEQRTKEIGIRKVLGASTMSIIRILTREFTMLVLISSVLAWAVSWLVMDDWLNRFTYQTTIQWYTFLLATIFALIIALLISSLRAWVASQTKPVITLKYE